MGNSNAYVSFLIGDLEHFILSSRTEISKYIENSSQLSFEETLSIFNRFSETLSKTTQLMEHLDEISDRELLRDVFFVSSESLAWILFALPAINDKLPVFLDEIDINGQNIYDALGSNLLQIESLIENPSATSFVAQSLKNDIKQLSMTIGHIANMINKSYQDN